MTIDIYTNLATCSTILKYAELELLKSIHIEHSTTPSNETGSALGLVHAQYTNMKNRLIQQHMMRNSAT
jgi:hypothetical protein